MYKVIGCVFKMFKLLASVHAGIQNKMYATFMSIL